MSTFPKYSDNKHLPAPADEQSLSAEWLQNEDVMKLLHCSLSTLKNLRSRGQLPFSKISGTVYYNLVDIQQMLIHARRRSISGLVAVVIFFQTGGALMV